MCIYTKQFEGLHIHDIIKYTRKALKITNTKNVVPNLALVIYTGLTIILLACMIQRIHLGNDVFKTFHIHT